MYIRIYYNFYIFCDYVYFNYVVFGLMISCFMASCSKNIVCYVAIREVWRKYLFLCRRDLVCAVMGAGAALEMLAGLAGLNAFEINVIERGGWNRIRLVTLADRPGDVLRRNRT